MLLGNKEKLCGEVSCYRHVSSSIQVYRIWITLLFSSSRFLKLKRRYAVPGTPPQSRLHREVVTLSPHLPTEAAVVVRGTTAKKWWEWATWTASHHSSSGPLVVAVTGDAPWLLTSLARGQQRRAPSP